MHAATARQLVALNRRFYTDFGDAFSATRGRIQPGVQRILARLKGTERILDLGCGNGQLARALAARRHAGTYLGLDFSVPLLEHAAAQGGELPVTFLQADLATSGWADQLMSGPADEKAGRPARVAASFDLILAFAVLHHIPGLQLRHSILQNARRLLAPGGRFIHSEWQFLNSERMKARILPWEQINLSGADVDEGDHLLDWRHGGVGLRYVHHFSLPELAELAAAEGFRVADTFSSDGQGGRLSLYQIWEVM